MEEENHNQCRVLFHQIPPNLRNLHPLNDFSYLTLSVTCIQYCVLLKRMQRFDQKQVLPFVPARYIRTFDVISEVYCVLSWS